MSVVEDRLAGIVVANNRSIASHDRLEPNPRPLGCAPWHAELVARHEEIRAEWSRFRGAGGRLPLLDDLIGEPQGAAEAWTAGLMIAGGRPVRGLADRFPATVAAVLRVPGIRSALWSVMAPGAVLPEHAGPNAGVLRYHLGIDCPDGAALRIGEQVIPYREGAGVLFDDTVPHEAWNRGDRDRVTLFLELLRPLPTRLMWRNRGVQRLISLDRRYRRAPNRARALDEYLNGGREAADGVRR